MIICSLFSVLTVIFYGTNLVTEIDSAFSARIKLARATYEYYGISLLGQKLPLGQKLDYMPEFGLNGLTLDSTYYSLMFSYGIFSFFIVVYLLQKTINAKNVKMKDVIFIDVFAVFALMETSIMNPLLGFPLLLISEYLDQLHDEKREKNKIADKYITIGGD